MSARRRRHTPWRVAFRWNRPWPGSRRGLKLWLVSILLGFKGLGYALGDWDESNVESSLRLFTEMWDVPVTAIGLGMIALCTFAAFTSYCHHGRDQWGYVTLTAACFGWATCYAVTPLLLDGPWSASWQGALNYLMAAALLLISASDPEPLDPEDFAELALLDARSEESFSANATLSGDLHEVDPDHIDYHRRLDEESP